MKDKYPKFEQGQIEKVFSKLSKNEKEDLKDYVAYRQARGITTQNPLKESRRHVIQLRFILEKPINQMSLKDLRSYLALLSETNNLMPHTKNDIKINIKNFLKWKFKDWSARFGNLEDIRLSSNIRNEEKLNSKTMLKKEDIEKFMKNETKMYWKAFFITQYEAGLRTKEVRLLKWSDIKFNVDGEISEVNIFATKTKRARPTYVQEATHYLKLLKEQQENKEEKGVYIFHSKSDLNKPIDKNSVARWMRDLSKKTGINCWNYLLRHSRATEVYRLAKQGKISKDIALSFMGHSEDMSHLYTHLDEREIKEMLKNQIYKLEDLPPERKAELEKEIETLQKKVKRVPEMEQEIRKIREDMFKVITDLQKENEKLKYKK